MTHIITYVSDLLPLQVDVIPVVVTIKLRKTARAGIFFKKLLVGIYNVYSNVYSNKITLGTSSGNPAKGVDFPFVLCCPTFQIIRGYGIDTEQTTSANGVDQNWSTPKTDTFLPQNSHNNTHCIPHNFLIVAKSSWLSRWKRIGSDVRKSYWSEWWWEPVIKVSLNNCANYFVMTSYKYRITIIISEFLFSRHPSNAINNIRKARRSCACPTLITVSPRILNWG